MISEKARLQIPDWKKWGPYLSERSWGTVREDYSADGQAWTYTTHDIAASKAWRWGEEGIGGFADKRQRICFSLGLWNKKDPILKERLFGLTSYEGNHGEDVKELYYYLDSSPTHSYMKMLYKYPQAAFPYEQLLLENRRRTLNDPEFELMDTGVFNEDKYFDVFIEYAKADMDDTLIRITAYNRGSEAASLHILPTIWFRNTWSWGYDDYKPLLMPSNEGNMIIYHRELGEFTLYG
ncbi:MAG TPA: glucosidase, partial [Puia sp.]|nr:glucosidase [Puia sp.]